MNTENKLYLNKIYLKLPEGKVISYRNNQNLSETYTNSNSIKQTTSNFDKILTITTESLTKQEITIAIPYSNIAYIESCEQEGS